jgi:hypothetical protein
MDDGSKVMRGYKNTSGEHYKYFGGCKIATCSFSEKECQILINFIKSKYDIQGKIYLTHNTYPVIFFNVTNARKLVELIKNYIPNCMKYKISIERETLEQFSDDIL